MARFSRLRREKKLSCLTSAAGGPGSETDGSKNDITHQAGIHCRNGVENVLITSNLIAREEAPEMRYGIHLRETTGVILANLITGVKKRIHIPRAFRKTVEIE